MINIIFERIIFRNVFSDSPELKNYWSDQFEVSSDKENRLIHDCFDLRCNDRKRIRNLFKLTIAIDEVGQFEILRNFSRTSAWKEAWFQNDKSDFPSKLDRLLVSTFNALTISYHAYYIRFPEWATISLKYHASGSKLSQTVSSISLKCIE